ncbi:MAG: gamma-glutamylcyclotransferase, partial [Burkholderiaceae bacterium]
TPESPGLVAGLDRGGSCAGVAFRLPAATVRQQFARLWQREMFLGAYRPRWLRVRGAAGQFDALAFVIDRHSPLYCGGLGDAELGAVLRHARGEKGSSLEYLEQTVAALRAEGLHDRHLERIARLARQT